MHKQQRLCRRPHHGPGSSPSEQLERGLGSSPPDALWAPSAPRPGINCPAPGPRSPLSRSPPGSQAPPSLPHRLLLLPFCPSPFTPHEPGGPLRWPPARSAASPLPQPPCSRVSHTFRLAHAAALPSPPSCVLCARHLRSPVACHLPCPFHSSVNQPSFLSEFCG